MWSISQLPVRRVEAFDDAATTSAGWPWELAPVRQLLRDGLDLGRATVLVGENGSGKSTLVEAIAMAYGLAPEGGSVSAGHQTSATESPLHAALRLARGVGASRWGYFVRAETLHGLNTYLAATAQDAGRAGVSVGDSGYHDRSHGEGFADLLASRRFEGPGFFVFDEPESGLSFTAQLRLLAVLLDVLADGRSQVLIATHSPVLAALPDAELYELDAEGMAPRQWEELALVEHHRRFLAGPESYLRHLR